MRQNISTLLSKYSRPVPRYTSYPAATQFTTATEEDQQRIAEFIFNENEEPRDISLYLHLPFCQSLCWYCGCNTVISRQQEVSNTYLDYLRKELEILSGMLNSRNMVQQLHYGGGTPTYLTEHQILTLGEMLKEFFTFSNESENSVEIDPRTLNYKKAAALRKSGFNRASIGVQDVNEEVQKAINRIQPSHQNRLAFKTLRDAGFESINADLIIGLPLQNKNNLRYTIQETISYKPERIAVFNYAHVPWMKPAQKLIDRHPRADMYEKYEMLQMLEKELQAAGYVSIGMDHFALPDDDLVLAKREGSMHRNFQGYSTRSDLDLYGIGMSSISKVGTMFYQNKPGLDDYYADLDSGKLPVYKCYKQTDEDLIRQWIIMRLMCDMSLDYRHVAHRFDVHFKTYFEEEWEKLKTFEQEGLLILQDPLIEITPMGRTFIRNIVAVFDEYYDPQSGNEQKFSKSI